MGENHTVYTEILKSKLLNPMTKTHLSSHVVFKNCLFRLLTTTLWYRLKHILFPFVSNEIVSEFQPMVAVVLAAEGKVDGGDGGFNNGVGFTLSINTGHCYLSDGLVGLCCVYNISTLRSLSKDGYQLCYMFYLHELFVPHPFLTFR